MTNHVCRFICADEISYHIINKRDIAAKSKCPGVVGIIRAHKVHTWHRKRCKTTCTSITTDLENRSPLRTRDLWTTESP